MDPGQRRLLMERQRQKLEAQMKQEMAAIKARNRVDFGLGKFVAKADDDKASRLAGETVGLVTFSDFQKIKEGTMSAATKLPADDAMAAQEQKIKGRAARLSFRYDDDDDGGGDEPAVEAKRGRLGPDPTATVHGSGAPPAARAEPDALQKQAVRLSCAFWDGTERRFLVEAKRGDTILRLLEQAQLVFPPLRASLAAHLVLVKENVILPHGLTVQAIWEAKKVHKGNELLSFAQDEAGVHVESSKNCKIVTRSWLDRNRHALPASQWVEYDSVR